VHKKILKPLVYLVISAQLLLAVPAMAFAQVASAPASMHCDDCPPCCPDGVDTMKDCLVSCMLAAVAAPSVDFGARAPVLSLRVDSALSTPLVSLSDPPLKPPPIR